MKVHRVLGSGFQGVIYQRALAIEMGKQGLSFRMVTQKFGHNVEMTE
jgi:hypothetical protein